MPLRAKFTVSSITTYPYGAKRITLQAQYDPSIPEDQRFQKTTPEGELSMLIDNPHASDQLVIGKTFYLDLTEVPATPIGTGG